jgi:hypothetical protein
MSNDTVAIAAVEQPKVDYAAPSSMATAMKAIEALREHGDAGVTRNLEAAAAVAAVKTTLPHGQFGRFCKNQLRISTSYRARLLKLDSLKEHVRDALFWATTQKHRLAECQSARNLLDLVREWQNKDEPPKAKTATKKRDAQPERNDAAATESAIQLEVDVATDHEKTISELRLEVARRDATISDLRRKLAERDQEIATLRDQSSREPRDKVQVAKPSPRTWHALTVNRRPSHP